MKKIKFILLIFILLIGIFALNRNIKSHSANRDSIFISVDYAIKRYKDDYNKFPESLSDLQNKALLAALKDHFANGLNYKKNNDAQYLLYEVKPSNINLFTKDRRFSSESGYPFFEKTKKNLMR